MKTSRRIFRSFSSRPKFVAAATALAIIGTSHATIISLDFEGTGQISTLPATAVAGVVPAVNWNSLPGLTGASVPVIEQGGTVAAVADWTAPGNGNIAGNTGFNANEIMMEGYLRAINPPSGATIPATVSVGLSAATLALWSSYDIYVYSDTGLGINARILHSPSGTLYNHSELSPGYGQSTPGSSSFVDSQTTPPGNYVVYTGMTDASFQIDVFANGNAAALNGIQIVGQPIPEPTTGILGILGAASLILFRRRS